MKHIKTYGEMLREHFPVVAQWTGIDKQACYRIAGLNFGRWTEDVVRVERETYEPITDDDGSVYIVRDGFKKLVKVPDVEGYSIKEGVEEMSELAFKNCTKLVSLTVPYTVSDDELDKALEQAPNKDRMVVTVHDWPHDCRISDEMVRDIDEGYTDEQGFVYSKNRKRLLRAAPKVIEYWIPEGVEKIERLAFNGCRYETVHVPYTCKLEDLPQEECPVWGSERVQGNVIMWQRPYSEQDEETNSLCVGDDDRMEDEQGVVYTRNMKRLLYSTCKFEETGVAEYNVPNGVVTICSMAFSMCRQFVVVSVPRSVRMIGDSVFGPGGGKIIIRSVP